MDSGYILVVDDEPNARAALAEILRDEGYRVETAADGSEALGKLEHGQPDIVLTDLQMPGMNGLALLHNLRAQQNDAVVVVMTGFGAVDTAVSAMKEGATDYLTKPINITELVLVLERGMERRRLRRESEQAKLRLEATNRDLEEFGRRVAHDLRAPLAPIPLLAGSLKFLSVDPKVARTADRIAANIRRASEMIEGLLTFSRLGRHEPDAVTGAAGVIRESLDDFSTRIAEDQVTLETDLDSEATVACAAGLFRQIVDNLVGNALKHLKGRERRWLRVRLAGRGGFVELEVEDSGPGIPADSLARIFELFYRVPEDPAPGTGIGLATVRRILDAHDGEITVRSVVGQGTSFRARLPVAVVAPGAKMLPTSRSP